MPSSTECSSQLGEWVSQHIFYYECENERVDALLLDGLQPVVRSLAGDGLIDRNFFIRYRARGPHVRLRLHAASSSCASVVEERSRDRLTDYLNRHPSPSVDWVDEMYDDPYPNNSVQTIAYEPEVQRYGGERGVEIAERHFHASSDAVLDVLGRIRESDRSADLRLWYALQLTAMLILSAGFDRSNAAAFVEDHLTHIVLPDFDSASVEATFDKMRDTTLPQLDRLLQLYERDERDARGSGFVEDWIASTQHTTDALEAHVRDPATPYEEINPAIGVREKYGLIIQSYIHMTLNRMGIWGASERFVLELLHRMFAALADRDAFDSGADASVPSSSHVD